MYKPEKIRNIAIIAHIDHGKTTLLNTLLMQSNIFRENQKIPERVMDSYDQERERGITIFSKHTTVYYGDYTINMDAVGALDSTERLIQSIDALTLALGGVPPLDVQMTVSGYAHAPAAGDRP